MHLNRNKQRILSDNKKISLDGQQQQQCILILSDTYACVRFVYNNKKNDVEIFGYYLVLDLTFLEVWSRIVLLGVQGIAKIRYCHFMTGYCRSASHDQAGS